MVLIVNCFICYCDNSLNISFSLINKYADFKIQ